MKTKRKRKIKWSKGKIKGIQDQRGPKAASEGPE